MNRILLIGNSGLRHNSQDGQTVKVRLCYKKMVDEGFLVDFVDLENFFRRPFSTLYRIKKGIKNNDRIVLITAERGSKILLPLICKWNSKYNKPFVFPLIGTSVLHSSIDKLNASDKTDFLINRNYELCKYNSKLVKYLRRITYILPETDSLTEVFKGFYKIENVKTLTNFRDIPFSINHLNKSNSSLLRIVYLSRVMEQKGIFDLIDCVNSVNHNNTRILLDIYGGLCLDSKETDVFYSLLSDAVRYKGQIKNSDVIETLRQYDLFVFPTKFVGEGTPGVIVESLIAGLPVLTSNFPQVSQLLKVGFDSLSFDMFNKADLKNKLLYIINNRESLSILKTNASESGKQYTYDHERNKFLKYVCGVEV